MAGETLTRAEIISKITDATSLNRQQASDIMTTLIQSIASTLSKGESVKISSFGTFSVLEKDERVGRNPRTGEEAVISPRKVISFRASPILKDTVQKGKKK